MTDRDHAKLTGVHPDLIAKIDRILEAMRALGFTLAVTDGVRTEAQQQALYAQGRTASGPIVTHADGVLKKSNHQIHDDGYGHAVDCCFWNGAGPSWDAKWPWKTYGSCAEALGLKWGGNWQSLHDLPHVELT